MDGLVLLWGLSVWDGRQENIKSGWERDRQGEGAVVKIDQSRAEPTN